ncbi:MAG: hypothetical protein IPK74_35810 [Deltaproteobacteria bacterium]|nr:hypothetical protein [Deltaproteobacteria bacterium]
MEFWRHALVGNLLVLAITLAIAATLRARIAPLRRLGIPDGLLAGALALLVGPSALDVVPHSLAFGGAVLEPLVYHGFAVVFIALGLRAAPRVLVTPGARSLAFGFIALAVLQSLLGFAAIAAWSAVTGDALHPGFGFMLMLGFAQGPGQALSLGSAWEPLGFVQGAQIGLLFAALGFAACCVLGIPLVAWARRRGWLDPPTPIEPPQAASTSTHEAAHHDGGREQRMEPLTLAAVCIGCVYALVFAVLWSLTSLLPSGSSAAATVWGFHFLVGSALAITLRRVVDRTQWFALDDIVLSRIAITAVDLTTAAALGALELDAIGPWLAPILVIAAAGGVFTLVVTLWLGRRAFPDAPLAHVLMLFGTSTGTMPTGFALLRMVDPELRGPVARSTVLAATAAVPLGMPLFLAVIPISVSGWRDGDGGTGTTIAMLVAYAVVLFALWRRRGGLRSHPPWWRAWPRD